VVQPEFGELLEQIYAVAVAQGGEHRALEVVADGLPVPLVQLLRPVEGTSLDEQTKTNHEYEKMTAGNKKSWREARRG
jgi:hypothetical protein